MYSVHDTPKGWVAPFGHPGIKACSRLPRDFRSVPRPSSPPGAKASTRCPSHTQTKTHHAQEPSTPLTHASQHRRTHQSPQSHGKPYPSLSTHIQTPLNTAAPPAIGTTPPPRREHAARRVRHPCQHSHGHPRTEPRTNPHHRCTRPKPSEVSCASRDAPEPDSQSTKNNTHTGHAITPRALQEAPMADPISTATQPVGSGIHSSP